jgi:MFS family permease
MNRSLLALCALNFFMADVRDGLGPFLGVFLQKAELVTLRDRFRHDHRRARRHGGGHAGRHACRQDKRAILAAATLAVIAASLVILFLPSFAVTSAAQSINAIAAAMMPPAVAAITLGLVKETGLIASLIASPIGLAPVQMLDGIGAGMLGVAVPGLVVRILAGTGHVNAGLGATMTMQGIGASLSATAGGMAAEHLGYAAAFIVLAGIALLALVLWVVTCPITAALAVTRLLLCNHARSVPECCQFVHRLQ